MPLRTWDTKAEWDADYRLNFKDGLGTVVHYQRDGLFSITNPRFDFTTPLWSRIVAHFNWPLTHNIIIIGCGFGWGVEYLRSVGYVNAWGSDISAYIQAEKGNLDDRGKPNSTDPNRVRPEDFANDRVNLMKNTIGTNQRWDVVATENLLPGFDDAEVVTNAGLLHATNFLNSSTGIVLHIVTPLKTDPDDDLIPRQDQTLNWKTLADWKLLLPNDIIISDDGQVILE